MQKNRKEFESENLHLNRKSVQSYLFIAKSYIVFFYRIMSKNTQDFSENN